jgi:AsmA protein
MRPAKLIALILGGLVALVLIAAIVIPFVIDPNDYKDRIAQETRKATGRDLELKGDLKLSIFPWLAIETGEAVLGNPAGFGPGPFVTLQSADVGVKLIPLLRGQLEIRRLKIDGMQVNLVKNADGHTNWEDLTGKEKPKETPAESTAPPTIAGLSIRDSALDYRNLQEGSHQRLQDLEVETGQIGGGKPVDLKVGFKMDEGPNTASTTVKLETRLTADTEQQRFNLKDLALDVTQHPVEKGARELPISLRMPSVDADLNAQTLAVPQFSASAAGAELSGDLKGQQIVDKPVFVGGIALKQTSLRKLLTQLGQEAPRTRDPKAFDAVALTSRLQATDKSVIFNDLKLSLDGAMITGSAGIADLDKKSLRFDLSADRLDLDRYQAPEEEGKAKGKAEEPFELPVDLLRSLDAKGKLAVGTLKVAGMTLSSVKLSLDAGDGIVRVNPSDSRLFGGAQHGTVAIDARGPVAKLSLDQQLKGIDFATLFTELFQSQRMTGRGDAKAVLSARGNDMDAILASLDGRIDFNVANGALKGADLWYEIRRARALWKREPMPSEASLGETRFKALKGSAQVTQGLLENRDLVVDMDYLKVNGEGKLDLKSSKVDYRLTANVYELPKDQQTAAGTPPATGAQPATDAAGTGLADLRKAEIPVRVTGTLEDLKIRPDLEAVAKAQMKGKVEEKKEELSKKLSDKLSDWLGNKKP